ncbi:ABC transporter ATP-binding protein [Actinophytocola algeriensis]|uniref:NitT/TauT family transport system ATP-binding protein n=1 Tax=Actinophytocola algeriensis TaxID=1768010 RepID=A0A7W7QF10_9PSEU|nr:ABC transporter ATP-binding protein [Actinophytocola algeriensis]MBB4912248.1 NitT/TauT family transport system ATP-binding protein [Actinophytocola algeriensis]MBE1474236.1 NitT/TauT family transport system ATP-binding protein [Actinophytocola algeriensis]
MSRAHATTTAPTTPGQVSLTGFGQWFRSGSGARWATRDVSLDIPAGQFVSVVGPSGCGKSTLLNAIAGLRKPSAGQVSIDGHPVSGVDRGVGYLFQRDALLPWRSVLSNVMLPLTYRGVSKKEAARRAHAWITRVGLSGYEDHYPHQLSGGMRKRVALAAVFVYEPRVLLMDEPFSALDVQTRNLMENELLDIWHETRPTVLFVTHDLEEALGLSDRVVVFTAGPGRIKSDYPVSLPRPRLLTEIRFDPAFQEQYETLWNDLRSEVMTAYEAEAGSAGGATTQSSQ